MMKNINNMKIAIILDEQYPNGMAATNRTHLYSKALAERGNDVQILVPRATDSPDNILNHETSGVHEGVKFRYGHETVMRKNFWGRKKQNLFAFSKSYSFLVKFKPDVILVVSNDLKLNLLGKISAIASGAKIVREKTEVPYYRYEELPRHLKIRVKAEFRMFDGIIVISPALTDFFLKEMKLKKPLIEIPILIGVSASKPTRAEHEKLSPTLVYTGSLIDHKDGVIIIIEAFAKIAEKYPEAKLILTGDIERSVDRMKIIGTIERLNLNEKVELTGYIPRERMTELTSSATALLLAKPSNRQNRYNMASKVGEYLLSGRPAIVSSVDPVCNYLAHRKNAFIIDPDHNQMAAEINFIMNNPDVAESVGRAGKASAIELFDIKKHAARMEKFFEDLKNPAK
jgi:glycosyltransferase involved in cell wall biosynthesis